MVVDPPCPVPLGQKSVQEHQMNPTQRKHFRRQVYHNCQCPGRPKRQPQSSDILSNSSSCEFSNQLSRSSNFSDTNARLQYSDNKSYTIENSPSNLPQNCLNSRLNPQKSNCRRRSKDSSNEEISDLSLDLPQNNTLGKNDRGTTPTLRHKNLVNAVSVFCRTLSVRQLLPLASRWLISILMLILVLPNITEACSSRSTPRPRPISPTLRPNITFQTYACPPAYAAWYCLNGATCFTVKVAESILYNCECSDGFRGQRCEFKDLEGSYHRPGDKVVLQTASLAGSVCVVVVLAVFFLFSLLTGTNKKQNNSYQKLERSSLADGEENQLPLTNRDIVRWSSRDLPSYGALLDIKTENNVKSQSSHGIEDDGVTMSNSDLELSKESCVSQEGPQFSVLNAFSTPTSKLEDIPQSSPEGGITSPNSQFSSPMSDFGCNPSHSPSRNNFPSSSLLINVSPCRSLSGDISSHNFSGNSSPSHSHLVNISPSCSLSRNNFSSSLSGNNSPSRSLSRYNSQGYSLSGNTIFPSRELFSPVHQKNTSRAKHEV